MLLALVAAMSLVAALAANRDGGDYFYDSASIDALVRLDFAGFFAEQPLMGALSLLVRAPFVALVFDESLTTVYLIGVIPCYLALLVLARVLWARMGERPLAERVAVVCLCAGSPFVARAVHWGHPEEFLATALCVAALLAAGRGRGVLAGVLLGLAFASKQWAVVAGPPVLAMLPGHHWRFVASAAAVAIAFTLPMLLGDPDRFWLVTRAAGSSDPSTVLGLRPGPFPDGYVTAHTIWTPLAAEQVVDGRPLLFMPAWIASATHPLIVLASVPLAWIVHRRNRGPISLLVGLRLFCVVLIVRCALDPNNLDYYHLPIVATLAAVAAHGTRHDVTAALAATAGLGLAFANPTGDLSDLTGAAPLLWAIYMATLVPLTIWLWRGTAPTAGPLPAGGYRRSPHSQATAG